MDNCIVIYDYCGVKIHRKNNTIIIQIGKSLTMIVYQNENDAIFASLGMFVYFNEQIDSWFIDE